jgi:GNAT superfamily N-acetyltransferase
MVNYISSKNCIDLRSRILRPGQNIELCHFLEDDFESTFHLGITIDNQIVCNGTFMENTNPLFSEFKNQYRLRGMATDLKFQSQGYGQLILQKAEEILSQKKCELLWCNARQSAFSFYEKCGFQYRGDLFDIESVGPHKVMFKEIK